MFYQQGLLEFNFFSQESISLTKENDIASRTMANPQNVVSPSCVFNCPNQNHVFITKATATLAT
jgi:hypothetical protein